MTEEQTTSRLFPLLRSNDTVCIRPFTWYFGPKMTVFAEVMVKIQINVLIDLDCAQGGNN